MRLFQINLLLAGGWCALVGTFDLGTFVRGFLLAFAALSLSSPMLGRTAYFRRVLLAARLGPTSCTSSPSRASRSPGT